MENNEPQLTIKDLPISFIVKYLGWEPARGLWGMKNTRKPIDNLVLKAKSLSADKILPRVQLIVDKNGLVHRDISNKSSSPKTVVYGVNEISYGVQDIVYSRVFSVIIVTDKKLDEEEAANNNTTDDDEDDDSNGQYNEGMNDANSNDCIDDYDN